MDFKFLFWEFVLGSDQLRFTRKVAKYCWLPKRSTAASLQSGCSVVSRKLWPGVCMMMNISFHWFGLVWIWEFWNLVNVFNCQFLSVPVWDYYGPGLDPLPSDPRTALSRFFGIQERQGRFLEPEARADVYKCGMAICRGYLSLAKHAIKYGRDEMRLRPKLHEPSTLLQQ